MNKLPDPDQIHRIIFGYMQNRQEMIVVMLSHGIKHLIPLSPENVKWVSNLKHSHKIPVYGQNNRITNRECKQLWDDLQKESP